MERKVARLQGSSPSCFRSSTWTAEFSWAASFGGSSTGLPTIGEIPGRKNCWAALGYGGNGITYSRIAAEIIRSALTGEPMWTPISTLSNADAPPIARRREPAAVRTR